MKQLLVTVLFSILSFIGLAQDVIIKRDGSKIEAKVLEVSSSEIKFKRADQEDGPLRIISISEVNEIIYEDGSWDKFDHKEQVVEPTPEANDPKPRKKTKDPLLDNGFFIEGMIGYNGFVEEEEFYTQVYDPMTGYYNNIYTTEIINKSFLALQMRLGHKWYFGSKERKWRPGIQATWLRLGIHLEFDGGGPGPSDGEIDLSLLNVGYANIFKFNEKSGLEANVNFGFNIINFAPPPFDGSYNNKAGIIYGVELKYRLKKFAVGLDYSRMTSGLGESFLHNRNVISVSVGRKF